MHAQMALAVINVTRRVRIELIHLNAIVLMIILMQIKQFVMNAFKIVDFAQVKQVAMNVITI